MVTKRVRKTVNREVIYPYFKEYVGFTTDPYWKDILEKCSYGIFPKYFSFNPNSESSGEFYGELVHKPRSSRKNKSASVSISRVPEQGYISMLLFFQQQGGLISPQGSENLINESNTSDGEEEVEYSWSDLGGKKKMKKMLLDLYVEELKEKEKLLPSQVEYLRQLINIGNLTGSILPVLEKNRIVQIQGLSYNSERQLHEITDAPNTYKKRVKSVRKSGKCRLKSRTLGNYWENAVETLDKYYGIVSK